MTINLKSSFSPALAQAILDVSNVDALIRRRASRGDFRADPLPGAIILQLLQAAECAPSSYNSQPWHFIVIREGPARDAINQDLVTWGASWATIAPVILAVVSNLAAGTHLHGLNYAVFDCGMAVQNLLLQATSLELAAHPIGFHDANVIANALMLPDGFSVIILVAVGYPAGMTVPTNSRRTRKTVSTIANLDHWNGSAVDVDTSWDV